MQWLPASVREKFFARQDVRSVAANTGWLLFDRLFRMGIGLLVGVWVARYLEPARFGLLSYAGAIVALFSAFVSLGLDGIVVREIVRQPEREGELLGSTFVLKLVGGVVAIGVSVGTVVMIRPAEPETWQLVAIVASGSVFQAFDAIDFWFQSKTLSKYTVCAKNTAFFIASLLKVVLILNRAPLVAFAVVGVLETLLGAVGLVLAYRRCGSSLGSWRVRADTCGMLLANGWPLILGGLSVMIYMKIDQVMLGEMAGSEAVGIYSAATRISEVWYFIPTAVVSSAFPTILRSRVEDESFYQRRLQRLFHLMVLLALAVSVPMTFAATPLILILYGRDFAAAGPVLAVHIWASLFVFLGVAQGTWDLAENLTKLALFRTSVGALINVLLNLVLIPMYGPLGAAIATVVSYAVSAYLLNAINGRTRPVFMQMTRSFLFYKYLAINVRRDS